MNVFTYEIEGKKYRQEKLSIYQGARLGAILGGKTLQEIAQGKNTGIADIFLNNIRECLSLVLVPDEMTRKQFRKYHRAGIPEEDLEFFDDADYDFIITVLDHFFDCNQALSVTERVLGIMQKMLGPVKLVGNANWNGQSPTSPEVIHETVKASTT